MDTPGYDPVSATGQVAGGANLICFTTGRGSAYGCAPSPFAEAGTNTALWQRRKTTSTSTAAASSTAPTRSMPPGERIFRLMLATASAGRPRASGTATARTSSCPGNWAR
jgi:altronate hydrolase